MPQPCWFSRKQSDPWFSESEKHNLRNVVFLLLFTSLEGDSRSFCWLPQKINWNTLFSRESFCERRVLLPMGVCCTSSHLLILASTHHLHIFSSSDLHICSSHLLSLPLPLPLLSSGNPCARNEVRWSKTEGNLRLWLVQRQPFQMKWGSSVRKWCVVFANLLDPVKGSVCRSVCVWKLRCVKVSVFRSVCM